MNQNDLSSKTNDVSSTVDLIFLEFKISYLFS